MMSYVFTAMLVIGFIWGIVQGDASVVSNAVLSGAGEAVQLSLSMCGSYAIWMGVFQVAEDAGMVQKIAGWFRRPLRFLFRSVPQNSKAFGYIALNLSANMLGLGNAATPSGISAMKELQTYNKDTLTATNAMCMLLIINSASVQLIPTGVIAVRHAAGSENAAAVVITTFLTSVITMACSVLLGKLMEARKK